MAAFLGGLAVGAGPGGWVASRLSPGRSLQAYVMLELGVVGAAWILPLEISAFTPLLRWAYADGAAGLLFPLIRVAVCLVMVFIPAVALGATFPLAIRWYADDPGAVINRRPRFQNETARRSSALYFVNTVGAALGARLAGFVLIPALGITGTTRIGMAASVIAALGVWVVARRGPESGPDDPAVEVRAGPKSHPSEGTPRAKRRRGEPRQAEHRYTAAWLSFALAGAALTTTWTYSIAGGRIPLLVANQVAESANLFEQLLTQGSLLTIGLILPTAACLGAPFPLALAMVRDPSRRPANSASCMRSTRSAQCRDRSRPGSSSSRASGCSRRSR